MGEVVSINRKVERKIADLIEHLSPQQLAAVKDWYQRHGRPLPTVPNGQ